MLVAPQQARTRSFLQRILDPILRAEPEGKRIYGGKGPLQPGERLHMPALADTLDRLAAEGPDGLYRGDVGRAISAAVQAVERARLRVARVDLSSFALLRAIAGERLSVEAVVEYLNRNVRNAQIIMREAVKRLAEMPRGCGCGSALKNAIFSTTDLVGTHAIYNYKPSDSYGVDERALVMVRLVNGQWKYEP